MVIAMHRIGARQPGCIIDSPLDPLRKRREDVALARRLKRGVLDGKRAGTAEEGLRAQGGGGQAGGGRGEGMPQHHGGAEGGGGGGGGGH